MLRDGGPPLVIAHRGAWGADAPQNSLAALEAAIALGCDMVELDVRRTRDGRLIAFHDAKITGTAVAALDREQLLARVGPGQAPLLEEMLERARDRIALDIDLKEDGYTEQLTGVLARHVEPRGYVVTSFRPAALAAIRQDAPQTRTGLLLRPVHRPGVERRMLASGADFIAPHATVARTTLLTWASGRHLESFVWTVNDVRPLRALLGDARVAGIITDRPRRALQLRAEAAESAAA
jgi:glycerophosphoryl diester phosphodiesterase